MKKQIFFIFLAFFISHNLYAQLFLSGRLGLEFSNDALQIMDEDTKATTFTLVPRIAKISGHWMFGLDLGIEHTSFDDQDPFTGRIVEIKTNNFIAGPFVRYVKKPNEFMGVWGEIQMGGSFGNEKYDGNKRINSSSFYTGIRPGIIFYISKHLSFEGSFGSLFFRSNKEKLDDSVFPNAKADKTRRGGLILNPESFQFAVNWTF
jgi:hypothetical protein